MSYLYLDFRESTFWVHKETCEVDGPDRRRTSQGFLSLAVMTKTWQARLRSEHGVVKAPIQSSIGYGVVRCFDGDLSGMTVNLIQSPSIHKTSDNKALELSYKRIKGL